MVATAAAASTSSEAVVAISTRGGAEDAWACTDEEISGRPR